MFSYFYRKTIAIIGNTDLFIFCSVISMHVFISASTQHSPCSFGNVLHPMGWICILLSPYVFFLFFLALIWGLPACSGLMCFLKHNFSKTVTILTATLMNVLLLLSSCLRLQTYCDLRYHSKHRGCFNGFCSLAPSSAFFERWLYCTKALE